MDKYTLSAEPYLSLADEHGIARLEFLHNYLPQLVRQRAPDVTFTTIGDDTIELAAATQFPTTLGKGMVGRTTSTTDNVVTRAKRYVF